MNWQTKRVVDHCDEISLNDVVFKVSQAGRNRVNDEKRKNVHAGVLGYRAIDSRVHSNLTDKVTYNPYTHNKFLVESVGVPIEVTGSVYMNDGKVFI